MKIKSTHDYLTSIEKTKSVIVFNYNWHGELETHECHNQYVCYSEKDTKRDCIVGQWNVKLKNC